VADLDLRCPHCQTAVLVPPELAGQTVRCPECEKDMKIPMSAPPPVVQAKASAPNPSGRVSRAGWICFGLGVFFAVVLFVIPIWALLFVASIILGIIATVQKEKNGLALLLCSFFAPPVLALLMFSIMFIGGCGMIAAGLQQEVARSGQQASRQRSTAKPTASTGARKTSPVRTADLGDLLCRLDGFAREVGKAETTILKKDAISRFHREGKSMFANTELELHAKVKDIKMVGNGKVELSFSSVDLGEYAKQAKKAMRLQALNCKVKIPMAADNARKVRPGQLLTLRVSPTFTPRNGDSILSAAHSVHTDIFNITVNGSKSFFGYDAGIRIGPLTYSIKNRSQPSGSSSSQQAK
jgi:hypothetical protein